MATNRPKTRSESIGPTPVGLADFQLREAEWVWSEMEDFVRLVQKYRSLYVTALFASIGWLLAKALEQRPPNATVAHTFDEIRRRPDIAAVLCLIPVLNSFFVALIFEAQFQMQSLAAYRLLLGQELGRSVLGKGDYPVWRWELWKRSPVGSIRRWTNPSNIFFGLAAIAIPIAALWFAWPAIRVDQSRMLRTLWATSAAIMGAMLITSIVVGILNFRTNRLGLRSPMTWERLLDYRRR